MLFLAAPQLLAGTPDASATLKPPPALASATPAPTSRSLARPAGLGSIERHRPATGLLPATGERVSPFGLEPGHRQFQRRLSFSPGIGWLGTGRLYAFRLGYNPNSWFGYEIALGHAPGQSVHALFHSLSLQLRPPLASRLQPYATLGYGMMLVFPGHLVNADAVTKNSFSMGGGLELYIRDDVALRGELRHRSVIGRDPGPADVGGEGNSRNGVVYAYREATLGLTFYRSLGRRPAADSHSTGGLEP